MKTKKGEEELIKKVIKKIYFSYLNKGKNIKVKYKSNISLNTKFEGNNITHENVSITNSKIGYGTYIGENSTFINTIIGKYCSIASNVKTVIAMHPTNIFVSTHPAFFSTIKQAGFTYTGKQLFDEIKYIDKEKEISVIIGNDVWIGENVTILGGVTIGDGAIIGAGAVVTKDIEPYSINSGVPSKKMKYRFEKNEIDFLENFKWWDKPEGWIIKNIDKFQDIKKFVKEEDFRNE